MTTLSLLISILYNLFVHYTGALAFKEYTYQDKVDSTLMLLFIAAIVGIVLGRVILQKKKQKNGSINNGLFWGGISLLVTSIWAYWMDMGEEGRLILLAIAMGSVTYIATQWDNEDELDFLDN